MMIQSLIWKTITELLTDPQLILDYYLARPDECHAAPHELKRVRQELSQIENQKQWLLDACQAQVIELGELETRLQVLQQRRQVLEQRLSDLDQLAQQQARKDALASDVTQFCQNVRCATITYARGTTAGAASGRGSYLGW